MNRIGTLMIALLVLLAALAGLAEGAACRHENARWVQWGATYKIVDNQKHWKYPQLGNELYCTDCKHYISVKDMDAQAVYAEAKDVMADARALMKAMANAGMQSITEAEDCLRRRLFLSKPSNPLWGNLTTKRRQTAIAIHARTGSILPQMPSMRCFPCRFGRRFGHKSWYGIFGYE